MRTSRSGLRKSRGRRSTPSTTLKTDVVPPIARATVATTIRAAAGRPTMVRQASRRSKPHPRPRMPSPLDLTISRLSRTGRSRRSWPHAQRRAAPGPRSAAILWARSSRSPSISSDRDAGVSQRKRCRTSGGTGEWGRRALIRPLPVRCPPGGRTRSRPTSVGAGRGKAPTHGAPPVPPGSSVGPFHLGTSSGSPSQEETMPLLARRVSVM